jgi:glycosyltransferase involved in cell wall biosynthesis
LTNPDKCAVVIPCFNEEQAIGLLIHDVLAHVGTVVVVDDGSTDGTRRESEEAGAQLIRLPGNSGKGAALITGIDRAAELGFDHVITMDGDGQHDPDDLPAFLKIASSDEADLVVGNRMSDTAAMPLVRRVVNRWMSRRISRLAGAELPDTQCGYRLSRTSAWCELSFSSSRFEIESEMLLAFVRARKRIRFIPVRTVYKSERSKIHPLHDTIRWFRWWRHAKR